MVGNLLGMLIFWIGEFGGVFIILEDFEGFEVGVFVVGMVCRICYMCILWFGVILVSFLICLRNLW